MDAESYFSQVRALHSTIVTMHMRLQEAQYALDMLKSAMGDGMPRGTADGKTLERAVESYDEMMDAYAREFARWLALKEQAIGALDKARERIADGSPHAVRLVHIDIVEEYYIERMSRDAIAGVLGYSPATVARYKSEALDWMDHATALDGYPIIPLVSE